MGIAVEQLIFERLGFFRGALAAAYLALWIEAAYRLEKFPTTEEYARYVGKSERQAWRHRARIHEALPGDEMEVVVMAAARDLVDGQDPLRVEVSVDSLRESA